MDHPSISYFWPAYNYQRSPLPVHLYMRAHFQTGCHGVFLQQKFPGTVYLVHMRLCSFSHIWTVLGNSASFFIVPYIKIQYRIWAIRYEQGSCCMIINSCWWTVVWKGKFGLRGGWSGEIWLRRRELGKIWERRSGPIYISIPPKTKRCSTNTQKTISPPPGYRLLPCWLSKKPSP